MASELVQNITGEVASKLNINDIVSAIPGVSILVTIAKAIGVLVLIYISFLIVKAFIGIKSASRLKRIADSVESIDKKLDLLVGKRKK